MKNHLLGTDSATAWGAKLSQTEVAVHLEDVKELKNIHACSFVRCHSSSSVINAAIGSELAGKRTFALCSLNGINDLYALSFMRMPVVLANMCDHSAVMLSRDSGCLIFMPESNQEIVDTIIQAYRVCEDAKVMLPAIVSTDIANYREMVQLPNETYTKRFVSKLRLPLRIGKKRSCFGMPVDDYAGFKLQQQKAMKNAIELVNKTSELWRKNNNRALPMVEKYKADDADFILVMSGFHSTTAKSAVNLLRKEGVRAGLVRIRVMRPWPEEEIRNAVEGRKVCTLEQHAAIGSRGAVYNDIKAGSVFISLGRHLSEKDFIGMFRHLQKSGKDDVVWLN